MRILTLLTFLFSAGAACAQNANQTLSSFNKIVASQHIHLVLIEGDTESIRFDFNNIVPEMVNYRVNHRKLRIYLENERVFERKNKLKVNGQDYSTNFYHGKSVTAYVTYKELKGVEIRGEESLTCSNSINSEKFKLKVLGEVDVELAGINADKKFKTSVYGENTIRIQSGTAGHQVYRLFGENKIDTRNLVSQTATSRMYGVGQLRINAENELKITALGEPQVLLSGGARIHKGLVLGEPDIRVRRTEEK